MDVMALMATLGIDDSEFNEKLKKAEENINRFAAVVRKALNGASLTVDSGSSANSSSRFKYGGDDPSAGVQKSVKNLIDTGSKLTTLLGGAGSEKLAGILANGNIISQIIAGGAWLSSEIDKIGIERMYKDYDEAAARFDETMSQQGDKRTGEMQDLLSDLYQYTEDDNFGTMAEQLEALKGALPEIGPKLAESLPDLDQIKEIQNWLDEGKSWEDVLSMDTFTGEWWSQFARDAFSELTEQINGAGEEGGAGIEETLSEVLSRAGEAIMELGTDTGESMSAGGEAGSESVGESLLTKGLAAVDEIQEALSRLTVPDLSVDVTVERNSVGGGRKSKGHATGMYGGDIVQGLTPIGYDWTGTLHYAGESGAEAVVGVNSLDRMIQASFDKAMTRLLGKMDSLQNKPVDVRVNIGASELAHTIAPHVDRELGTIASWRGGGRA